MRGKVQGAKERRTSNRVRRGRELSERMRRRRRRQLGQVIRDNLHTRWIILDQRHDEPGEELKQPKAWGATGAEQQRVGAAAEQEASLTGGGQSAVTSRFQSLSAFVHRLLCFPNRDLNCPNPSQCVYEDLLFFSMNQKPNNGRTHRREARGSTELQLRDQRDTDSSKRRG